MRLSKSKNGITEWKWLIRISPHFLGRSIKSIHSIFVFPTSFHKYPFQKSLWWFFFTLWRVSTLVSCLKLIQLDYELDLLIVLYLFGTKDMMSEQDCQVMRPFTTSKDHSESYQLDVLKVCLILLCQNVRDFSSLRSISHFIDVDLKAFVLDHPPTFILGLILLDGKSRGDTSRMADLFISQFFA